MLFTEHASQWWPVERRHTKDAASAIRIEPSGRFFERARDGTEAELGVVRQFVPASRLVLDWYPGTGRQNPTQVEVAFEAIEAGTRVTITHGPGSAPIELYTRSAPIYGPSWDLVLAALVRYDGGTT